VTNEPAWSPPGPAPESGAEVPAAPVPAQPAPAYPVPAYPPPYDSSGYAAGYGTAGYTAGYAYPVARRTNSMAIASMTTSIVGLPLLMCYGLGLPVSVVGAVLGHIAKKQIKERQEAGDGMALAGIIMGWVGAGLAVLGIGALAFLFIAVARTGGAG
jgi:uncharacterized membrane protein YeaQ/YmgE (transglycosylase-associated protein family)